METNDSAALDDDSANDDDDDDEDDCDHSSLECIACDERERSALLDSPPVTVLTGKIIPLSTSATYKNISISK